MTHQFAILYDYQGENFAISIPELFNHPSFLGLFESLVVNMPNGKIVCFFFFPDLKHAKTV